MTLMLGAHCRRLFAMELILIRLNLLRAKLYVRIACCTCYPYLIKNSLKEQIFVLSRRNSFSSIVEIAFIWLLKVVVETMRSSTQRRSSPFPRLNVHIIKVKFVRIKSLSARNLLQTMI